MPFTKGKENPLFPFILPLSVSVVFVAPPTVLSSTPFSSHQFPQKQSLTQQHAFTYATHCYYLLLVGGLQIEVCEGSGSAHAAFVPLGKVAIQLKKEQIALSPCFFTSDILKTE